MTIPDDQLFNAFLGSLRVMQPLEECEDPIVVEPAIPLLSDSVRIHAAQPIRLGHDPSDLSSASMLKAVSRELKERDHPAGDEFARVFLAAYALRGPAPGSPVSRLVKLLDSIGPAKAWHYQITGLPFARGLAPYHIGPFRLGPLRRDKLTYWCKRVGCDYFDRYPNAHVDSFAVESEPAVLAILDVNKAFGDLRIPVDATMIAVRDHYFDALSLHLCDSFTRQFREVQYVPVAAGAPYLDPDQPGFWMGSSFVTVYWRLGDRNEGYFSPNGGAVGANILGVDDKVTAVQQQLQNEYSFTGLGNSELHTVLGVYCRFLTRAASLQSDDQVHEAFLHRVIALDLLLGDKQSSADRVSSRAGAIVGQALDMDHVAAVKLVKDLYDARSRFVHQGRAVGAADTDRVGDANGAVLRCLLRLQTKPENHEPGFIGEWLKRLDLVAATLSAHEIPSDALLESAGIV